MILSVLSASIFASPSESPSRRSQSSPTNTDSSGPAPLRQSAETKKQCWILNKYQVPQAQEEGLRETLSDDLQKEVAALAGQGLGGKFLLVGRQESRLDDKEALDSGLVKGQDPWSQREGLNPSLGLSSGNTSSSKPGSRLLHV